MGTYGERGGYKGLDEEVTRGDRGLQEIREGLKRITENVFFWLERL